MISVIYSDLCGYGDCGRCDGAAPDAVPVVVSVNGVGLDAWRGMYRFGCFWHCRRENLEQHGDNEEGENAGADQAPDNHCCQGALHVGTDARCEGRRKQSEDGHD